MEQVHLSRKGYSAVIYDKYILCGTNRQVRWVPIDNIKNVTLIRRYASRKILMNNLGYHIDKDERFRNIVGKELIDGGYTRNNRWLPEYRPKTPIPDFNNKDALEYLIKKKILTIVKMKENLDIEEEA